MRRRGGKAPRAPRTGQRPAETAHEISRQSLVVGAVETVEPGGTKRITEIGCQLVEQLAREGLTQRAIAARLRMTPNTLRRELERNDEAMAAFERGHAALEGEVTDILLQQARKGNTIAAIFLAKARLGWREGEARDGAGQVNVQINLPAAMSADVYRRTLDIDTPRDPDGDNE